MQIIDGYLVPLIRIYNPVCIQRQPQISSPGMWLPARESLKNTCISPHAPLLSGFLRSILDTSSSVRCSNSNITLCFHPPLPTQIYHPATSFMWYILILSFDLTPILISNPIPIITIYMLKLVFGILLILITHSQTPAVTTSSLSIPTCPFWCPPGTQCVAGKCVPLNSCANMKCRCGCNNGRCQICPACPFGCPPGQSCIYGRCQYWNACSSLMCPPGQICVNGGCIPPNQCVNCGIAHYCVNGVCVPRHQCGNCGINGRCVNGRCVPLIDQCFNCGIAYKCVNGKCVPLWKR